MEARHRDFFSFEFFRINGRCRHDHRPVIVADRGAAGHQRILIGHLEKRERGERGDFKICFKCTLIQRFDVLNHVRKRDSVRPDLLMRDRVKHKCIVGVGTVPRPNFGFDKRHRSGLEESADILLEEKNKDNDADRGPQRKTKEPEHRERDLKIPGKFLSLQKPYPDQKVKNRERKREGQYRAENKVKSEGKIGLAVNLRDLLRDRLLDTQDISKKQHRHAYRRGDKKKKTRDKI